MNLLEQLKALLEQGKDDKEVQAYLGEFKKVGKDDVTKFLASDEGKKILQPINDEFFTKGLKTWQDNNLSKIKDDAVAASKNETPDQKEIREMRESLNSEKKARVKEAIKNKVLQTLATKGLSPELVDLVSRVESEDEVDNVVSVIEKVFVNHKEKLTSEFQQQNGRNIVAPGKTKLTKEVLKTLTPEQINQFPKEEIDAVLVQG